MKSKILNYVSSFLNRRTSKVFLSLVKIGCNPEILNGSNVRLMCGSTKEDIIIGDNFRCFGGTLVSQNGGKIIIGDNVKIGNQVLIGSVNSVTIKDNARLADNITVMDNNNHPINPLDREIVYSSPRDSEKRRWKYSDNSPIVIGRHTWIGSNSRICKGVTIGDGSIVAASAVVTKDVPENSIVAGNPGRIVKRNIDESPRIFTKK